MSEEIFDVVDEQDRVVRQAPRREVHRHGWLHRAVHVLLLNSSGRMLLQRRSATKDTFPHCWGAAASGHVDAGETYDACVVRELREEVGIALPATPERILRLTACAETGNEFVWVYLCRSDAVVRADAGEVSETGWFSLEEIDAWVNSRPAEFTPSFVLLWQRWRAARA